MRIQPTAAALILVATACSTTSVPSAPAAQTEASWPSASAEDGRSRLQLNSAFLAPPTATGAHPRLFVQGRIETGDPDLVMADVPTDTAPRATLVVDDDPRDVVTKSVSVGRFGLNDVSIENVDAGAGPRRIRSLLVECRLLRVKKWATVEMTLAQGGAQKSAIQAPFEIVLTPEKTWVWLGIWSTDKALADYHGVRHAYSARESVMHAVVRDARGTTLEVGGGSQAWMFYDHMHPDVALAYPVTATVRVPVEFDVVPVSYRFTDLDVSKAPRAK